MTEFLIGLLLGLLVFTNICWFIFFDRYRTRIKSELKQRRGDDE